MGVDLELEVAAENGSEVTSTMTSTVSFRADVPAGLLSSMQVFIERHPNWDQYRLVQAALAGFLVQNGCRSREVTRCYLANLFPGQRGFAQAAPVEP